MTAQKTACVTHPQTWVAVDTGQKLFTDHSAVHVTEKPESISGLCVCTRTQQSSDAKKGRISWLHLTILQLDSVLTQLS